AWPVFYAAAFNGFYFAMMLALFALFLRPLGFEYRAKIDSDRWRGRWAWALTAGSAVPALIFGGAFGNLLQGVPFHFDELHRLDYTGRFWALLNTFALLAGMLSRAMIVNQGATSLQRKTDGELLRRRERLAGWLALVCAVLFV